MNDDDDPQTVLHEALDRTAGGAGLCRCRSIERTAVCTIWDPHEQFWIESDDDLRKRIKERLT